MKINMTTLPTGLRVVTAAFPGFQSASASVFVKTGSRDETEKNSGIAHFLEHMAFKGTSNRTAFQISSEVEQLGSYMNAYTSVDTTAYYVSGLGSNIRQAVEILGDIMTSSIFSAVDIDVERGVILQEINQYMDNPSSVAMNKYSALRFPNQSIGRPILGNPDFIKSATTDDFLEFVEENYNADNMIVVGSGNVSHDEFVNMVGENFSNVLTGGKPKTREIARYGGGNFARIADRPFEQVTAVLGFPSVPDYHEKTAAYGILCGVLGDGASSPLYQEIRDKRGLVYAVGAWIDSAHDYGFLNIRAGTTPDKVEEFLKVSLEEVYKLTRSIDDRDITRAKNSFLVYFSTNIEKPFSVAQKIADNLFYKGSIVTVEEEIARINSVTTDDIVNAANELIKAPPTMVLVGPSLDIDYMKSFSEIFSG